MDWSTNNVDNKNHHPHHPAPADTPHVSGHPNNKSWAAFRGLRLASVALLFSTTILVIALLGSVVIGTNAEEGTYVDTNKAQAVFLDNGQAFFGRIVSINDSYLRLKDVYYLRQAAAGSTKSDDAVLAKLGCELVPRPTNELLLNREHVTAWENFKEDGNGDTVSAAIHKYIAANPEDQKCQPLSRKTADVPATPAATTTKPSTPAPATPATPSTTRP